MAYIFAKKLDLKVGEEKSYIVKVVGFKDKKNGRLLISQNLWLTIIGLVMGLPVGDLTLKILIKNIHRNMKWYLY